MAAGAHRELRHFDKADQMIKDSYLKVALEYGEDNVTIATILNGQGMLYKKWGKLERALDSYERSYAIKVKFFGEDHPETCTTRHNIGELYVSMAQPERAKEQFDANLEILSKKSKAEREEHAATSLHTKEPVV